MALKRKFSRGDHGPFSEYFLSVELNGTYHEVAKTMRNRPAGADVTNITPLIHQRLFD